MLEFIRKYAQGFVAWVIFGALILAFALWGIQSYFSPSVSEGIAKVNGEPITAGQLQNAVQVYQARLRAMLGKNYDPKMFTNESVKNTVIQSLINESVLAQAADKAGYRIGDAELSSEIRGRKEFQRNGVFDESLYEELLRNQGMSPARFEHDLRRALLVDQLSGGVQETSLVTDQEVRDVVRLKDQQRDLGYFIIPAARFTADIKVDDAAVKAKYEKDASRFSVPEQISVDYLDLSVDDLAKDIHPSEADLRKYYDDHAGDFGTDETRHASHILIAVPKDADDKTVAAARAKAEDVLKKVHDGQSFAELAKKYSDDPGSAKQGGDLGYFGRGTMDPAFEKAVFALSPGQVSDVVRSAFGFHIIKLLDIKAGKTKTFEQVRDQIDRDYTRHQAEDRFYNMSEKLENLTYEHPDTLQNAADALGMKIQSTGFFTRSSANGNELATHPEVRQAAFEDDVLNNNYNSLPVEVSPTRTVVLRKKAYKASSEKPLSEVENQIRAEIASEKAGEQAQALGQTLIKRLRAGDDPAALAKEYKLTWERPGFITRNETKVTQALVQDVFKQAEPGAKPEVKGLPLSLGNYAVYAVYAVKPGDVSTMKEADLKALKQSLTSNAGNAEFQMILKSHKEHAEIKINKSEL
jgi:peptidyl-prolyl cis-trans isomerase D